MRREPVCEGSGLEPTTIGNYTLIRLLGRGSMGAVYEARHNTIERRAAIKILHKEFCEEPEVLQRFLNEARAVNIIDHPGLVGVSELGKAEDGARYIVMEYLDGITLREHLLRSPGRLPVAEVIPIARQIASTLAAAHAKQVVHRDLKPVTLSFVDDRAAPFPGRRERWGKPPRRALSGSRRRFRSGSVGRCSSSLSRGGS